MSDQPKGQVPIWVFVVTFVLVAAVAGGVGWFLANSRPAPVVIVPLQTTTTVEASTTLPVETTAAVTPTATVPATSTPKPTTIKEPCLVTKVTWSSSKGYQITVDYVQILTGKAAADAATAHGDESPPPDDYYILNDNKKLRTFLLPNGTPITVLGWGGTDSNAKKKIPVGQFMDIMPGGVNPQLEWTSAYYYVTVKNGKSITKIDEIYFP